MKRWSGELFMEREFMAVCKKRGRACTAWVEEIPGVNTLSL
ncbi:MAG TPA: hypothetical protein VJK02_17835 [Anaerolineales bacterium]|nr:hypothetical protein [Anaerolineales bacterium]